MDGFVGLGLAFVNGLAGGAGTAAFRLLQGWWRRRIETPAVPASESDTTRWEILVDRASALSDQDRVELDAAVATLPADPEEQQLAELVERIQQKLTEKLLVLFPDQVVAGRYRITDLLGAGGMGITYLAEDATLGRDVAIKVCQLRYAHTGFSPKEKLMGEARAIGRLDHPGIVRVYDVITLDAPEALSGHPGIVMEAVRGRSLRQHLAARGRLSWAEAQPILIGILRALEHAHSHQVLHLDLKPENVMVVANDAGSVKVIDFGLARLFKPTGATQTLSVVIEGSAPYMPPEHFQAGKVGEWTDIYAVGVIAHELLAGTMPLDGGLPADVPEAVRAAISRATDPAFRSRYAAARDFREALEGARVAAPPATPVLLAAPRGGAIADSPAQIVDRIFAVLPAAFVKEKATGWAANMHFDITGASPWTVRVNGGTCTTSKGLAGDPTCVVKTDAKTYGSVLAGSMKAEKAFMDGKITATNLGDMMKFGGAFDMKMIAVSAQSPAAVSAAAAVVAHAFERMPEVFLVEKAKDWAASLQFAVSGAGDWTVNVVDNTCRVEKGRVGSPTCVVTTDALTYSEILAGRTRAERAFMEGRIVASNLGDMMRFAGAFDSARLAELLREEAAPASK